MNINIPNCLQWLTMILELLIDCWIRLNAELFKGWKDFFTETVEVYSYNISTSQTQWEQPCDKIYKEEFRKRKNKDLEMNK